MVQYHNIVEAGLAPWREHQQWILWRHPKATTYTNNMDPKNWMISSKGFPLCNTCFRKKTLNYTREMPDFLTNENKFTNRMIFDLANKVVGNKTRLVERWHGINYQNPESSPSQDQPYLESAQSKQWQKLWGGSATEEVDYTITKVAYLIFRSIHSLQNFNNFSVGSYENLWNVSILSSASYYLVLVNVSTHSIITVPAPLTRVPADP